MLLFSNDIVCVTVVIECQYRIVFDVFLLDIDLGLIIFEYVPLILEYFQFPAMTIKNDSNHIAFDISRGCSVCVSHLFLRMQHFALAVHVIVDALAALVKVINVANDL